MLAALAIEKQVPVRGRLLNHLRVQVVPLQPALSPRVVAVDHAREICLLACALAGELVEGEGGWD